MLRGRLDDLQAFVAVARERSFTNAAKLGVGQKPPASSLSTVIGRSRMRFPVAW